MIIHTVWQKSFDFFGSKPIVVEPSAGQLSSDAGLLPIREFDQRIGLTEQFAQALGGAATKAVGGSSVSANGADADLRRAGGLPRSERPRRDLPPRTVPLFMLGLAYHFP